MNSIHIEDKITNIENFNALTVEKQKHSAYETAMAYKPTIPVLDPTILLGIEVEVENIKHALTLDYYWKMKEDNSLRNNGREFTSIPLRAHQVENALNYLSAALTAKNTPDFSARTSIHMHLNVRDIGWEQIKVLILLYALFERHFFHIAGTKRETSVFCVPLYKTNTLTHLHSLHTGEMKWHKYNAINAGTILGNDDVPRFGTIEFRHLYGTLNKEIIINWINNILCLRLASNNFRLLELETKIKQLNTTSEYLGLYRKIFGDLCNVRQMTKEDFEHCVSTTKLALWGDTWKKSHSYGTNSRLQSAIAHKKEKKPGLHKEKANVPIKKQIWEGIGYITDNVEPNGKLMVKHAATFHQALQKIVH